MSEKQLVLAIFSDEVAAEAAVESLKGWDKADDDLKLNAIGVLVLDDEGKVKAQKLGKRSTGKGAGIGLVLAIVAPVGLLAGALAGGLLGALHRKGLGISAEDRDALAVELADGKAAVGVLVTEAQAAAVSEKLVELGGASKVLDVSDEDAAEADEAAPAVEAAEAEEAAPVVEAAAPAVEAAEDAAPEA